MTKPASVIIAGAGIAGLSAAIALGNQGFEVRIFEKAPVLSEQGAGIQLGPNATAILRHWGLEKALLACACMPEAIELHDGIKGQHLISLPVARFARHHWHAPYATIHRADLQSLLKQTVESNPAIHLQCDATVCNLSGSLGSGFEIEVASQAGIEKHRCGLFLACDGVWSDLRKKIGKGDEAKFSGSIAWRATIERFPKTTSHFSDEKHDQNKKLEPFVKPGETKTALEQSLATDFLARDFLNNKNVRVFMGANGHFIAYPLKRGDEINLVAITSSKTAYSGNRSDLTHCFSSWQSPIADIITKGSNWTYWPLYARLKPYFLSPSGVVFLGDSAHATTPFAAQGAAMALEDAAYLAAHLPNPDFLFRQNLMPQILKAFAKERRKRVSRTARRGAFNHFVYHAEGQAAAIRNLVMRRRTPEKFLSDLDWLYKRSPSIRVQT